MKKNYLLAFLFVQCFSGMGQTPDFVWAKQAGGTSSDYANSSACDWMGNTYVTGIFRGTATFGDFELTADGLADIFIAKLNQAGDFLWVKQAGSTNVDYGNSIKVDSFGNSYITGSFVGVATFGAIELTSSTPGSGDLFVCKLDTEGNFIWAKSAGGSGNENGNCIALDSTGNTYVVGTFQQTANFGTIQLTASGDEFFIAKLNPSGDFLWVKKAGGLRGNTFGSKDSAIAVDSFGNAYVTGAFKGLATFGNVTLTADNNGDVFISKVDTEGNFLWTKQAGGLASDKGFDIEVDSSGNAFVTGYFSGTANFGAATINASGSVDIFITKVDTQGNFIWTSKAGGAHSEIAYAIALDAAGHVYITGHFWGTSSFGTIVLSSSNNFDSFIAALNPQGNFIWARKAGGIGVDQFNSIAVDAYQNVFVTGQFNFAATFGAIQLAPYGDADIVIAKVGNPCSPPPFEVDILLNETILSTSSTDATYQWIDCDNQNEPIEGETNQHFIPTLNGNYAVEVTRNECTLTSDCLLVTQLNLLDSHFSAVTLFPNPGTGRFTLKGAALNETTNMKVMNTVGQMLQMNAQIANHTIEIDLTKEASGVYFLWIQNAQSTKVIQLIKR